MKKIKFSLAICSMLVFIGCNNATSIKKEELTNNSEIEESVNIETIYDKNISSSIEEPVKIAVEVEKKQVDTTFTDIMDEVYQEVIDDSIAQYKIAKKHGGLVDICFQAGLVASAQLQAKNEDGYKQWKRIEKIECDNYENEGMIDIE